MMKRFYTILISIVFVCLYFVADAQSSNTVGAIPATVDVSPMGVATYAIPIEVVPGTQGIQPNLSVMYNSQSGVGLLGMKWHLSGVSSITRVSQTLYPDNNISGVNLDANDRFALDGNRLMVTNNGTYGANNTQYGTEIETFSKVTSYTASGINGPQYFKVITEDGKIIEYGNTNNSRQLLGNTVLTWMINKITDPDGNYMTFTYAQEAGEIWITEINYTGNSSLTPYAKVSFVYLANPTHKNTFFVGGQSVLQSKILTDIQITYNNSILRKYSFEYDNERITRLATIRLFDNSNVQLNNTTVEWGEAASNEISYNTLSSLYSEYLACVGDFNGDRITDIVFFKDAYQSNNYYCTWKLYLGNGDGTFSFSSNATQYGMIILFAQDVDGDLKDEMVYATINNNNNATVQFSYKDFPTGNSLNLRSVENMGSWNAIMGSSAHTSFRSRVYAGDFDGNGCGDIMFRTTQGNLFFWGINFNSYLSIGNNVINCFDLNGKGKTNIECLENDKFTIYEFNDSTNNFTGIYTGNYPHKNATVFHGDFNADGKQDVLLYYNNQWRLHFWNGSSYLSAITLPLNTSLSSGQPTYIPMIVDVNGDNKDDIIQTVFNYNTQQLTVNIYYSECLFNGQYSYNHTYFINNDIFHANTIGSKFYNFSDFNGDGKMDMLYTGSIYDAPIIVSFFKNEQYEYVQSIRDGVDVLTEFNYQYLSNPTLQYYGQDARYVYYPLVTELHQTNGIGNGMDIITYNYGYSDFDFQRRQFLGFQLVKKYKDGFLYEQHFAKNATYHLLQLQQSFKATPSRDETMFPTIHEEIYHTNASKNIGNNRFILYNSISSFVDYLKNTQIRTTTNLRPEDGRVLNVLTESILFSSHAMITQQTQAYTYQNITLSNSAVVTKPQTITTTSKMANSTPQPTHTTTFNYNNKGHITSKIESNADATVTITYAYNNFGLPTSKTLSSQGLTSRTEQYAYDATARFMTQLTNPKNHIASWTYDGATGNILTATDINGLMTTYRYDNFGRRTSTTFPDGTRDSIRLVWNNTSYFPTAKYYSITTATAQPSVTVYYDKLGREIVRLVSGSGYSDTRYDNKGQIVKTSLPYESPTINDANKIWHSYTYDRHGRLTAETAPYTHLSYAYNALTTTTTDHLRNNSTSSKTMDAAGRIVSATDQGGTISYTYSYVTHLNKIRQQTVINAAGASTSILNDLNGNRIEIIDPDAGCVSSTYNAFGDLIEQIDANGNDFVFQYDVLGRVTQKKYWDNSNRISYRRNYTYDTYTTNNRGRGQLASVTENGTVSETFTYDNKGRLSQYSKYIDGTQHDETYSYNANGLLYQLTYPNGFAIKHLYNNYGELTEIRKSSNNTLIYKVNSRNKYRQVQKCEYGNQTASLFSYNNYGLLTQIKSGDKILETPGGIAIFGMGDEQNFNVGDQYQLWNYTYDDKGLMTERKNQRTGWHDRFTYDNLDRLTSYIMGITALPSHYTQNYTYLPNGNIVATSTTGNYSYAEGNKPHAVRNITLTPNNANAISSNTSSVTYNIFNRPATIAENGNTLTLIYGADEQRQKAIFKHDTTTLKTKYFINKRCEYERFGNNNNIKTYNYIYAEGKLVAIDVKEGVFFNNLFYVYTDHLGSYDYIVDQNKVRRDSLAFDPWGNRRDYETPWLPDESSHLFDRGYCGHEHLDTFNIINMNARLYDPVIGRFFSPDPFVQMPDNTQSYNRYSYCLNNPLKYTDPDGEFWHLVIGGIVGGVVNLAANWDNIDGFWDGLAAFGVGAGAGVATAATGGAAGAGFWATAGVAAAGSAVTMGTNNIIAQTGPNFSGIKDIDLKQVGISSAVGAVSGFAAGAAGYWAANSSFLVNNISSPILKSSVISPLAAGAGHIAGGTTAGLIQGQGFNEAFASSFNGLGQSMAFGAAIGVVSTIGVSYANKISPWTGKSLRNSNITQVDVSYSEKQKNHNQDTYIKGKSYLTIDESILLNDINQGNYVVIKLNSRGMPIVEFPYTNIGNVVGVDGTFLGTTNQATIHINSKGQIHIVPRLK